MLQKKTTNVCMAHIFKTYECFSLLEIFEIFETRKSFAFERKCQNEQDPDFQRLTRLKKSKKKKGQTPLPEAHSGKKTRHEKKDMKGEKWAKNARRKGMINIENEENPDTNKMENIETSPNEVNQDEKNETV